MEYKEPEWCSMPICDYSLQIIKEGIIISDVPLLNKSFFTMSKEFADIIIKDPQIADFFLILQHSDQGYLFLYSLKEHGEIFLNKQKIKFHEYLRIYPNDIIEFGNSEVLVTVIGPSHMQRTEKMFSKSGKVNSNIIEKLHQVTWGFGEDAVNEKISGEDEMLFEENLNLALLKSRKNITDKQKKLIAKLENYQEKIEKLQNSIVKVSRSKNAGSNSDQMEKLNEKLENLIGEKELTEENLRSSFFPDQFTKKKPEKGAYDFSSDEDEYYNRAKPNNSTEFSENAQLELNLLYSEREEIANQITDLSTQIDEEFEDPLDAYMMGNSINLREENLKRLGNRLKEILEKIQVIEQKFPNLKGVILQSKCEINAEFRMGNKKRKIERIENSQESVQESKNSEKRVEEPEKPAQNREESGFCDWEPPSGQTGDGKTELNAKYGY